MLALNLNNNTRTFALSNMCFFVMAFINPDDMSYLHKPTLDWVYGVLILIASVAAVLCCVMPRLILARKAAEELCEDEETRNVFTEIPDKQPEELLARAVMEQDWTTAACLYSRGVPLDIDLDECKKQKVRKLAISLDFD